MANGARPATIKDVAARAGIGTTTVSRVLNKTGYVSDATRLRVEQAARELGYRRSTIGRNLRVRRTEMLGLLVADITNPFYSEMAAGALEAAKEHDHHLILCATNEDPAMESEYVEVLMESRVDGIVAVPTNDNGELWTQAQRLGVEVIFVDRVVSGFPGVEAVLVDNVAGAARATTHLLQLGHRRIGLIVGPATTTTGRDRAHGYRLAHDLAGVPVDEALIRPGSFLREHAREALQELLALEEPPTALFAANNALGEAAVDVLADRGLRVPDDVSLVLFDDLPWARRHTPHLTVVAQPAQELGRQAVLRLLHRLGRLDDLTPSDLPLPVELLVRDSTRSPTT